MKLQVYSLSPLFVECTMNKALCFIKMEYLYLEIYNSQKLSHYIHL